MLQNTFEEKSKLAEAMAGLVPSSSKPLPGRIVVLHPACERQRYFVTTSLTGWAQT